MTQHTDLIERLRKGVEAMDDCSDGVALIKCDALMSSGANALEAQAREIAELKAQESELCTLYGLAEAECQKLRTELDYSQMAAGAEARRVDELTAECKKLRAEVEGLRKDAERWRWATEQAEFFSMVVDGTGLHCAEVYEAESAVDAAIAEKGQP